MSCCFNLEFNCTLSYVKYRELLNDWECMSECNGSINNLDMHDDPFTTLEVCRRICCEGALRYTSQGTSCLRVAFKFFSDCLSLGSASESASEVMIF